MADRRSEQTTVLFNGEVITPRRRFAGGVITGGGRITGLFRGDPPERATLPAAAFHDVRGNRIVPGFIDLHLHGGSGIDFNDASAGDVEKAALFHATAGGTTALVPTLLTGSLPRLKGAGAVIRTARLSFSAPEILGIHLEGPFLNPAYRGAHPAEKLRLPSPELVEEIAASAGAGLVMMTLAPELPGGMDAVSYLHRNGIVAALGHSGAAFEQVRDAAERGLSHAVHTYSAMGGFHHRAPGTLGAVLSLDRISAELIADGVHTHPAAARILFRVKGPGRVVLVTDASPAAGLDDGDYTLGGQKVLLREGRSLLPDGTLAGSTLTMNRAVAGAAAMASLTLAEALAAATVNPARVLGIDGRKGSLEEGKDADLVVMDHSFAVLLTMCRGRVIFNRLN